MKTTEHYEVSANRKAKDCNYLFEHPQDATGLSSALLKPCLSKSDGFPCTFTPLVTHRVLVTTLPSLHLNLTQELKPEVKWFTHFC